MSSSLNFGESEQADLMSAAVRLYEAGSYGHCMSILEILMRCKNKEAYILAGHCIIDSKYHASVKLSRTYYEIACDLGSGVGCYNLYLSYAEDETILAATYLDKAKSLGWVD